MTIATPTLSPPDTRGITIALFLTGSVWALAVAVLADRGVFLAMPMPAIALLVAVGILVPTAAYFFSRRLQGYIEEVGPAVKELVAGDRVVLEPPLHGRVRGLAPRGRGRRS